MESTPFVTSDQIQFGVQPWAGGPRQVNGWQNATDIYIETPANGGDDSNAGTSPFAPLATPDEWFSRFGNQQLTGQQTVHFGPGASVSTLGLQAPAGPGFVTFQGTRSYLVGAVGTVTVIQAWAANAEGVYSIPGIDFTNVTGQNGYRLEIVGGPRAGTSLVISKNLGGGQILSSGGVAMDGFSAAAPLNGDVVQAYTSTRVSGATVGPFSLSIGGSVNVVDMDLGPNTNPTTAHSIGVELGAQAFAGSGFYNCILRGPDFQTGSIVYLYGCQCLHTHFYGRVPYSVATTLDIVQEVRTGGCVFLGEQTICLAEGPIVGNTEGPGYLEFTGLACVRDYTIPLQSADGSVVQVRGNLWLHNSVASGVAIEVNSASAVLYSASGGKPVITGTAPVNYALVGGATKASGAIPYADATNGARFAQNA